MSHDVSATVRILRIKSLTGEREEVASEKIRVFR